MSTKFAQLPDSITVYQEGKTWVISKSIFPLLYEQVVKSVGDINDQSLLPLNDLEAQIIKSHFPLNDKLPDLFSYQAGNYLYKGAAVHVSLGQQVQSFIDSDLPILPILNFLDNTLAIEEDARLNIHELVASGNAAITYDGNIVFYTRASWSNGALWSMTDLALGEEVQGNLTVGLLEWTVSGCPDQGPMSEVVVRPQNIKSIEYGKARVSSYIYIGGPLSMDYNPDTRLIYIQTLTNSIGEKVHVRLPYSPETLTAYLSSVAHGSIQEPVCQQVVSQGVSC
jgi:hypothetical protein